MRMATLNEIRMMVEQSLPHWKRSIEYWEDNPYDFEHADSDVGHLQLVVATDDWCGWGYRTGYPDYDDPLYSYRHWAIVTVTPKSTVEGLMRAITEQLDTKLE